MTNRVRLTRVDEKLLDPLLSVAVAEADPGEVMPAVSAPPGWSVERREAFREFHQASFGGLDGPTGNQMYAIVDDTGPLGVIRMARCDEPGTVETGIWLARSARGRGIATTALRLLLAEAARVGARLVVAETTTDNAAALGLLRRCGAVLRATSGGAVRAEFRL